MFYEDNYHANNENHHDDVGNTNNKHKSTNPNYLTYKKPFNQKWKDGKYYKNINIGCYKSGGQGEFIYNAVSGLNTQYRVGSNDEDMFFIVTDNSGKFSKERIRLYYNTPEQYENHQYEILSTSIKEGWHKKHVN